MKFTRSTGSIFEITDRFHNDAECRKHLVVHRWSNKPKCAHCDSEHVYTYSDGVRYRCKACRAIFTVTVGTIFQSSKIALRKWFVAIYLEIGHKKGISSHQLARDIRVTQKTAWFMLHRIRNAMASKFVGILGGFVEADEKMIGGKEKNKHARKRTPGTQGRSHNKEVLLGAIQRGGDVKIKHVSDARKENIHAFILENVARGSILCTDEYSAYRSIGGTKYFQHLRVNHSAGEYVNGLSSTNTIENFWSQLARGILGVYHHVSPKHLQRYCDSFAFRFNTRQHHQRFRFNLTLMHIECRLSYKQLIADQPI